MKIQHRKLMLTTVMVFIMAMVQSCQEKVDVKPSSVPSSDQSVLEEIKNLGFDTADLKDKGSYYLVEGDIYFSKDKTARRKLPAKEKSKVKIARGERPAMTIALDQQVASNTTWKNGINYAIATWNANTDHHFSFEIINNADRADIVIQDDNGELSEDIEVASEFAAHGYAGSAIRVNLDHSASVDDKVKTKALEGLSHCVGLKHADLLPNGILKTQASARTETNSIFDYVYVINDDWLLAVNRISGSVSQRSSSWAGATQIASTREVLYVIQFDWLYAALPDGSWWTLGSGWSGTQTLVYGSPSSNALRDDSHALYAMQYDYLYGVSSDGTWWPVIQNGASTPWSGTKTMCANWAVSSHGLAILDRINTTPVHSVVSTDRSSPDFGVRKEWDSGMQLKGVRGFASYFDGGAPIFRSFFINSNSNYATVGLNAILERSTIRNVTSDQVIDYSKTQSFVSDVHYCYLLADGGLYSYGYGGPDYWIGDKLKTLWGPRFFSPTAIMTNIMPIP